MSLNRDYTVLSMTIQYAKFVSNMDSIQNFDYTTLQPKL